MFFPYTEDALLALCKTEPASDDLRNAVKDVEGACTVAKMRKAGDKVKEGVTQVFPHFGDVDKACAKNCALKQRISRIIVLDTDTITRYEKLMKSTSDEWRTSIIEYRFLFLCASLLGVHVPTSYIDRQALDVPLADTIFFASQGSHAFEPACAARFFLDARTLLVTDFPYVEPKLALCDLHDHRKLFPARYKRFNLCKIESMLRACK